MTSPRLGPHPTRPASRLSPPRARVASALAELGPGVPLTTLAGHLGGHPNATRHHLDSLVAEGLAEATPLPRSGRGRPATGYALTAAGRRALAGDPVVAAYAELVDALAEHLAATGSPATAALAIGRRWGAARVGASGVGGMLAELGFEPEPDAADPATLRLRACPILASARAHPEVICEVHRGLVEGALGSGAGGVRLVPFAEPGACVVRLPR